MLTVRHRHKKDNSTVASELDELETAAIQIQAVWRGKVARREQELFGLKMANMGVTLKPVYNVRIQLYLLFEDPSSSVAAKLTSVFILLIIIFSIICLMCETLPIIKNPDSIYYVSKDIWYRFEILCSTVFSIEFVMRLSVCNVYRPFMDFWRRPANYFDLMAIVPFYLEFMLTNAKAATFLRVLRAVRLSRLFRIFRIGKYSRGLRLMASAILASMSALNVLVFFISIGVILFSSMVYYTEKQSCPDFIPPPPQKMTEQEYELFTAYTEECRLPANGGVSPTHGLCCDAFGAPYDFPDIVATFWWAIVTMTTVGYGDVTPKTALGRLTGTVCMLCGILLIALPIAIVGRNFQDAYEQMQEETVLDTGKSMVSEEFKQKLAATPAAPKMASQALLPDLNVLIDFFASSCYSNDAYVHGKLLHMRGLVDQMEVMNSTLHRLEVAEQMKQEEIFENMEMLYRNLHNIKKKS